MVKISDGHILGLEVGRGGGGKGKGRGRGRRGKLGVG